MLSITSSVTTYEATCEYVTDATTTPPTVCTATWTGEDPGAATGWVFHKGTWGLAEPEPMVSVRCPSHASA